MDYESILDLEVYQQKPVWPKFRIEWAPLAGFEATTGKQIEPYWGYEFHLLTTVLLEHDCKVYSRVYRRSWIEPRGHKVEKWDRKEFLGHSPVTPKDIEFHHNQFAEYVGFAPFTEPGPMDKSIGIIGNKGCTK